MEQLNNETIGSPLFTLFSLRYIIRHNEQIIMLLPNIKYIILQLFCLGLIALGLYFDWLGIVGLIGLVAYIFICGFLLANTKVFANLPWKIFFASLTIFFSFVILHSGVYFLYKSTETTILLTWLVIGIIVSVIARSPQGRRSNLAYNGITTPFGLVMTGGVMVFLLQITLLFLLFTNSTTDAIRSPWEMLLSSFFILYAITTGLLLIYQYYNKNNFTGILLNIFHYAITFGVVILIYPLGFGYDPFLHRAAEKLIYLQGFIDPKTPFYIGQYVIVNSLAHITHLSVKFLDIILVPFLTTVLLPLFTYFGFKYGFKIKDNYSRMASILILIFPLSTFYVTTPHNLANLLTMLFILSSLVYIKNKNFWLLPLILALAAATVHPLTGIFSLILFVAITLRHLERSEDPPAGGDERSRKIPSLTKWALILILGSTIIPILLTFYNYLQGISPESIFVIKSNLNNFLTLFKEPHYFNQKPIPWLYDLIYTYRWLIIPIIIITAVVSFKKIKDKIYWLYPLMTLIILGNAFFVSTWINLKYLNKYEQLQYAERLTHAAIFFILPFAVLGFIYIIKAIIAKCNVIISTSIFILISILLTTSFYLLYPQQNPKVNYPGFNVTSADIEAAQWIHDNTPTDKKYLVLSNILTAATSIEQYGFSTYYQTPEENVFYYSIPSGGLLYQTYLKMLYEQQKPEFMQEIMDLTDTDLAYFVTNSYWHNADEVIPEAKKTANSWQAIDGDKIFIFSYNKK